MSLMNLCYMSLTNGLQLTVTFRYTVWEVIYIYGMVIFDSEITITENVLGIVALGSIIHAICTVVLCCEGTLVSCSQYYMQFSDKLCASTAFTP